MSHPTKSERIRSRLDRGAFLPVWPIISELPISLPALTVIAIVLGLSGAAGLGLIAVEFGLIVGLGMLAATSAGVAMLADVRAGLWVIIGVITLLPFAVVPIRVGVTLTLLEAASLIVLGVWLLRTLLMRDQLLPSSIQAAFIALFLTITLFSFLLGVDRGYTSQTWHDYAKFVFATLLVFVVWTVIRSISDLRQLLNVLVIGGAISAAIGLVFQALGPGFAERVQARLIPIGYPDTRIVRFIEDDPSRSMRLVSTSVDPNSAGGLFAIVFVIAAAQLISRDRVLPGWLCTIAVPLSGLALLLTYSRGAWLGAAAGIGLVAFLRYRWLIPVGLSALAAMLIAGFGSTFVDRLWQGFTLQDPATQMRLDEYRNAIAIIREYPFFGVGFGEAPRFDLSAGVSSIYLTIGQQTGFLGLAGYALAVGAVLIAGVGWWLSRRRSTHGDLMLTLLAAVTAALVIGVFDHYFFNIEFPHMAGLFWILIGLVLALARPVNAPVGMCRDAVD